MRTRTLTTAMVALAVSGQAVAWSGCEHRREIDERLDLSGSQSLEVIAAAGDLDITGKSGLDHVRVRATVCASEEDWAQEAGVDLRGGASARVAVVTPDTDWGGGNRYVYVDLQLEVPSDLALDVSDSSGDIELEDVGAVKLRDSSGDIEIDGAVSVEVQDSSGDIELFDVTRDVIVVSDSSGDIRGQDIEGSVLVAKDSSGDIRFKEVGGDFIVERDSSGDIVALTIGGDFAVLRDGSGEVSHREVGGTVDIPRDKR